MTSDSEHRPATADPWWQKPAMVSLLVGIMAGIGPAIHEITELVRSSSERLHVRRMAYVERIMDASSPERRLELLALIASAPESDDTERRWATAESHRVTEQIRELQAETTAARAQLEIEQEAREAAEAEYARLSAAYARDTNVNQDTAHELESARAALRAVTRRQAAAEAAVEAASAKRDPQPMAGRAHPRGDVSCACNGEKNAHAYSNIVPVEMNASISWMQYSCRTWCSSVCGSTCMSALVATPGTR